MLKLTIQIKLLPTSEQSKALKTTLELANEAANRLSQLGWEAKEFRQFPLHKRFYRQIRDEFPTLSSQVVIRLNAKVADAYKLDRKVQLTFRRHGSISYDARILDFQLAASTVSIWAVGGRIKGLPFVCGETQRKLLELPRGESDLILRDRKWYLNVTVDVPEEREYEATGWLGVDMGVVNIATTSDGVNYAGGHLNNLRERNSRLRTRLQRKGTKSARKLRNKRRYKEGRFARNTNHVISKQIVEKAKRTGQGIAIEELDGIRDRIRASKPQRRRLHSWAFADLRAKLEYKAKRAGVPVRLIDPRNTSRTCPGCGNVDKRNRRTRDEFLCVSCGHSGPADTIASVNIGRAAINLPHVGTLGVHKGLTARVLTNHGL